MSESLFITALKETNSSSLKAFCKIGIQLQESIHTGKYNTVFDSKIPLYYQITKGSVLCECFTKQVLVKNLRSSEDRKDALHLGHSNSGKVNYSVSFQTTLVTI